MTVSLVTTTGTGTAKKTTKTKVDGALSWVSGCTAVWAMKTGGVKLTEGKAYQLVVAGVPTAENAASGANMAMGSLVVSVGKVATGGFGYSSA